MALGASVQRDRAQERKRLDVTRTEFSKKKSSVLKFSVWSGVRKLYYYFYLSSLNRESDSSTTASGTMKTKVSVHWFRHGLRLHDNPALLESITDCDKFYAIFIHDGQTAGLHRAGYNRVRFLCESLQDLDQQLREVGGQLYVFEGNVCDVIKMLHRETGMSRLTMEQDCEAIWYQRDEEAQRLCEELGIEMVEHISHTLWDPFQIIHANGGTPPLTYEMFLQVASALGRPPRPSPTPDWSDVMFGELMDMQPKNITLFPKAPRAEDLGFFANNGESSVYVGGETAALKHMEARLLVEENAFRDGYILPNQVNPDLTGPPMSMSAALRFGCLSVRRFYWAVQDVYQNLYKGQPPPTSSLTAQLIWREFFYCMSADNPKFDRMEGNPICIQIPWYDDEERLKAWEEGRTGYPFIDACMRQLLKEGWIHHVGRTAVSCFLTRGDLRISWEKGLEVFLKYLLDADWSVCAGNWMWVSSSAFERQLDCSSCICPVNYGRRIEPTGDYIRRYVPELAKYPVEYIYEPWKAPKFIQEAAGCIVGRDYPHRIVKHEQASRENKKMMEGIRRQLQQAPPPHCCPSHIKETRRFLRLSDNCFHNLMR
ncbi:circadian regulator cryptochrome isoform X2 [Oratosquilla oratoria]|uniref:circadian regulator cryptochrome isoform X2 n=2 Tax=Oratosquilla oratoria TaxID=337810 RepID=UPI003F75BFA9